MQHSPVEAGERAADASTDAAVMVMDDGFGQHARCQHRAKRQRHDRRQQYRHRQHEAEFAEQPARLSGQERQRDEHGGERRGGRDDGEEHLAGAKHGGGARAHALVAPTHDVLEHHDGVVDNQAGRQHQRQQRQDVDREPGHVDRGDRADQRDRHGEARDQRGAPVAQEQIDDGQHDRHRQAKRQLDLMDGAVDEGGVIAGHADIHAFGQRLLDLGSGCANARSRCRACSIARRG